MKNERHLIIHADDAGLSNSQNSAIMNVLEYGVVKSYSIMSPCPWFFEIASFACNHPNYDVGIHLTLTCEWINYKFGPVLPYSEVPSLVDKNGFFHGNIEEFKSNAVRCDIEKELHAQIERVIKFGIIPTHLDCHMFSLWVSKEFVDIYIKLGREYGLPVMLNDTYLKNCGIDINLLKYEKKIIVNNLYMGYMECYNSGLDKYYDSILDNLGPGFNVLLIHPAYDNQEMIGITKGNTFFGSKWRQNDFDYFTSPRCRTKILENEITLISWVNVRGLVAKS